MSARGTAKNARRAWENKTTLSTLTLLILCPRTGDGYLCDAQTV